MEMDGVGAGSGVGREVISSGWGSGVGWGTGWAQGSAEPCAQPVPAWENWGRRGARAYTRPSLSQDESLIQHVLENNVNSDSAVPAMRLERLLRERELKRSKDEDFYLIDGWGEQGARVRKQRLLVVANRLPLSAVRTGEDSWSLKISAGGVVSALLGVHEYEARWIGWAGLNVPDEVGQRSLTQALAEKKCIPVFLDEETIHRYYNGYCNHILWPLIHYLGLPQEDCLATTHSFQSQFAAYKKANQMFADVVNKHYEEGDIVWVHDFHLMFLPKYLKDCNNNMKVGWFHHSPFPSSEIYRTLPTRSELLRSVLAADLVGFHTYDFARHFVSSCTRILEVEGTPDGVEDQGKLTRVAVYPIGIDPDRFIRALELPQVKDHIIDFKEIFAGRKVILGVDRLDTIKGIPQKFLAFEKFLEENPVWRDKVVLVQIAVPTRTEVPEYQKLTSKVHEIVGWINGRFGTLTTVPIHHLDQSIDFHALCALYAVTDVALVTSIRDGMNLVSYEFVACQALKKGVLILSEFAGAAQSLGAGAILVNPWNVTEVAESIAYALSMPADEREKRHCHNFKYVTTHTSQKWAETFVSEFSDTIVEAQLRTRKILPSLPKGKAIEHYLQSSNRLIILGFHATLIEHVDTQGRRIDQFREMELNLHPGLKESLKILCDDPKTTIIVLSGSDRTVLDENFGEYNLWLAAEHGMFLRPTTGDWMTTMPENLNVDWIDSVKQKGCYWKDMPVRIKPETLVRSEQDEDIYKFFEPKPPGEPAPTPLTFPTHEKIASTSSLGVNDMTLHEGSSILDLKGQNYFSCAVGRSRSNARYLLGSSAEVVSFLKELANCQH
ncbi:hypothetical protein RD792_012170 [Penstemon davidsonii]|uniref:alpha,alpha-trehalose-phosphate synthase (UDP-forming) n=1 Tax=Penstemon davidsonii TaxID=160366 RepID=A0ABR0CX19_9LAMI|nr:hypothetical protein RD792_012170 [Penstemon davidsonii]